MGNKKSRIAKTATEALTILWEEGFFKNSKMKDDIEKHLSKRGNNFSGPELGMALKRARKLTRRGKRGAYGYIQKHPFVAEEITSVAIKAKSHGK